MKFFRKFPAIEGFDTESYKGNILLLASSNNYLEPANWKDIIEFLWYEGKELNFFYNIGFDLSIILKPLLMEKTKSELGEIRKFRSVTYGDFLLSWVGNKGFHISLGKRRKDYFDISQFYSSPNFLPLDTVAKEILGIGKNNEELGISREKIGNENGYYRKNRELIIKYCIQDAVLTRDLGIKKVQSIYEDFNFYPKKYYSNASISKAYLDTFHVNEKWQFWKLINGSKDMFEYIFNSYNGGIFNVFKLGNNEHISELDINSAYPDGLRKLTSIVDAKIQYITQPASECDYGFYKVKIKLNGLIPYRDKYHLLYPVSVEPIQMYITKIEYDYWASKNVEIEFIDGFAVYTNGQTPFQDYEELYQKRNKIKHNKDLESKMRAQNIKTILNATYGCFAESHAGFTYWSNFIYASYITARTRLTIYDMIEQVGRENVIAIMTDAVVFKDKGQKVEVSDDLGKFKYEDGFKDVSGIFYMNGLYVINKHLKKRGFPSLKIEDLKGKNNIQIKRLKIRKILEGIIQDKVKEIGDFQYEDKSIKLDSNLMKMVYPDETLNFDYLNSNSVVGEPILVSQDSQNKNVDIEKLDKIMYREKKFRRFMKR